MLYLLAPSLRVAGRMLHLKNRLQLNSQAELMNSTLLESNVYDAFPTLKRFGLPANLREIQGFTLAGIVNSSASNAYTFHEVEHEGEKFELRVCGLGDSAYFEWVNGQGQPVTDTFDRLTAADVERLQRTVARG
jgi:hypothetical protein